jgi:hypothetical protein
MPAVDIQSPSQSSIGGGKPGFGTGLPTPVLLALVGGGIGLVVFLSKRTGSNTGTGADKGTLLPNTAIMLGSLQQSLLQLQGDVTMGNADLSSQLTGVGENLGTQIDGQSAMIQQSFADLNTYLSSNFTSLQSSETSLSTAIAGLGTQNAALADGMTNVLNQLHAIEQGQGVTTTQLVSLLNGINTIQANQTYQQAVDLGTQADVAAIGRFLGWEFYQIPNRYAAYIPNQQPGGSVSPGSSVIGSV